jgi:hypothetical protein
MSKTIDKEIEFRNELTKIAFEKLMSFPETLINEYHNRDDKYNCLDIFQFIAMVSVRYADALIDELDR